VPRAFDELTKTTPGASDTAEAIKTPETLERSEADKPVEIQEDPSEQLQVELVVRMAITPIPKPKEATLIKLVQFNIPNLIKQNVRTWKLDVWEFCEI
jgi:hypothetical protein